MTLQQPPEFVLRSAVEADAGALARMRYDFRAEYAAAVEPRDAFVDRCLTWMRPRLAHGETWRCWVVERDGVIVGNAWCSLFDKMPNPGGEPELHGYVTNVFVVPEVRGIGLGGRLLEAAIVWCRGAGAHAVILWPSAASRTLYLRHGFAPADDVFLLPLWKAER